MISWNVLDSRLATNVPCTADCYPSHSELFQDASKTVKGEGISCHYSQPADMIYTNSEVLEGRKSDRHNVCVKRPTFPPLTEDYLFEKVLSFMTSSDAVNSTFGGKLGGNSNVVFHRPLLQALGNESLSSAQDTHLTLCVTP